jgi:uncharacterized peroxidase-related enzyme
MRNFTVPQKEELSAANEAIVENLEKAVGFRPNHYTYMARNETALADYLALQNRKSTLRVKERELINLVVSQVNHCVYCLAAHTVVGKSVGFTDEQILEIRSGIVSFDHKLAALASFVKEIAINRGHPSEQVTDALFSAGYTEANLIDIIIMIGDKTITNYLHGTTHLPVDFPAAPELEEAAI